MYNLHQKMIVYKWWKVQKGEYKPAFIKEM